MQTLDIVKSKILAKWPDVLAIYVFGSFGSQYETRTSDLDIAIIPIESPDNITTWNLAQEIAIAINRDVDLVDLKKASTVFCYEILTTGKRIYCSDLEKTDSFENLSWSMYLRFNEERKDIING